MVTDRVVSDVEAQTPGEPRRFFTSVVVLRLSMRKRVHVVGLSPRSGTTLMVELLVASYETDWHAEHEMSIFDRPGAKNGIFCSKNSPDLLVIRRLLWIDSNLWAINMVRDPRDIVVSKHQNDPSNRFDPGGRR